MTGPATRGRGRPVRVSREAVLAAATRMLSAGGDAGFSMRKLADELDASTAAVYHHFATKADLYLEVLGALAEELDRPDLPADPRERLVVIITHLIDTLHELPWVTDILVGGESFGRAAMWILDEYITAANELGASDEYAGYMYNVTWRFVLGELIMRRSEDERAATAAAGNPRPRWTDQATPELLDEFPSVVRMLSQWPSIRAAYHPRTAVEHLVDGLLRGIPHGADS